MKEKLEKVAYCDSNYVTFWKRQYYGDNKNEWLAGVREGGMGRQSTVCSGQGNHL